MTEKPDWWPKNPYPIEIFPMPRDEYQNIVPDPHIRTALSGMLGREFWEIASGAIWDAVRNNADDENAEMLEVLTGDVIELGNLAMMVDPELTKQYMESVYTAIAKAEGNHEPE